MKNSRYPLLVLKGIAMGAADVIPGVSGGTIAFITGIYEELLDSIKSIDLQAVKLFFTGKWKSFWKKINGNFLLSVVAGIAISVFSLARLMTYLLETHPIPVWSFFFGLIIASSFLVAKDVSKWNWKTVLAAVAGAVAGYGITALSPATTPDAWWFIILSGAIAICAMILPGISGSFILLLLGKYEYVMEAVGELNIGVILLFLVGAVAGIISFSHFLSWLLKRYRNVTIAVLMGFMIGSLNKIWPWKEVLETYIDSHGEMQPFKEANILPHTYEAINQTSAQLGQAVGLCVVGFLLVIVIEAIGRRMKKRAGTPES